MNNYFSLKIYLLFSYFFIIFSLNLERTKLHYLKQSEIKLNKNNKYMD